MTEDLGMIACRAMDKAWSLPAYESWQAVADAVVAAHEARRWRPIESAPKDGTPILVENDRGVHCVRWEAEEAHGDASFDGWYVDDGKSNLRVLRGTEPTHWTPIPAPPKEGE